MNFMDVLATYMKSPLMPRKLEGADIVYMTDDDLCDEQMTIYIQLKKEWWNSQQDQQTSIISQIGYEGDLTLIGMGSVSFLADVLVWMTLHNVVDVDMSVFQDEGIVVTMRRKKTLAFPLVVIINAIKTFLGEKDLIDLETFAYDV